jgi:hypothetical protein
MRWPLTLVVGGALALAACNNPVGEPEVVLTESNYTSPRPYGIEGTVTAEEIRQLEYLAWPQEYDDIKGLLGLPAYRSTMADIYEVEGSEQRVTVFYDGDQATGFEIK